MSDATFCPVRLEPAAWGDLQIRKNNLILRLQALKRTDDAEALAVAARNAAFAEWMLAMHYIAGEEHSESLPNLLSAAWCWTHAGERANALAAVELLVRQAAKVGEEQEAAMLQEAARIKARLDQPAPATAG